MMEIGNKPSVGEFFSGKTVFITGATGHIGKVLLEKLLRSCTGIERIFVLMRGESVQATRLELDTLLMERIFDRIRTENQSLLTKVVPIKGNIASGCLGVSQPHFAILINSVQIVFHCAAKDELEASPRRLLQVNLLGTKNLLEICQEMKDLKAFIHLSTAYSSCNLSYIGEELYSEVAHPDQIITLMEWMSDAAIAETTQKMLRTRPSVYYVSRALAEIYLDTHKEEIPICIVRPTAVTGALNEPYPGWTDNIMSPSGLMGLGMKGILRTFLAEPQMLAHFVPIDVVINTMIVAAYYVGLNRPRSSLVVNCAVPETNPLKWEDVEKYCLPVVRQYPTMDVFRYIGGSFKSSYWKHFLYLFFDHTIPSIVADILFLSNRPNVRMTSSYRQLHNQLGYTEYFTTNEFKFQTDNFEMLERYMNWRDKTHFPLDLRTLNWEDYLETCVIGTRRYLCEEADENVQLARTKMMRKYYIWLIVKLSPLVLMMCWGKEHLVHFYILSRKVAYSNTTNVLLLVKRLRDWLYV